MGYSAFRVGGCIGGQFNQTLGQLFYAVFFHQHIQPVCGYGVEPVMATGQLPGDRRDSIAIIPKIRSGEKRSFKRVCCTETP